jgi:hypothetical protein
MVASADLVISATLMARGTMVRLVRKVQLSNLIGR